MKGKILSTAVMVFRDERVKLILAVLSRGPWLPKRTNLSPRCLSSSPPGQKMPSMRMLKVLALPSAPRPHPHPHHTHHCCCHCHHCWHQKCWVMRAFLHQMEGCLHGDPRHLQQKSQRHKRFKRKLFIRQKTQNVNFQGNPLYQATKRLTSKR